MKKFTNFAWTSNHLETQEPTSQQLYEALEKDSLLTLEEITEVIKKKLKGNKNPRRKWYSDGNAEMGWTDLSREPPQGLQWLVDRRSP